MYINYKIRYGRYDTSKSIFDKGLVTQLKKKNNINKTFHVLGVLQYMDEAKRVYSPLVWVYVLGLYVFVGFTYAELQIRWMHVAIIQGAGLTTELTGWCGMTEEPAARHHQGTSQKLDMTPNLPNGQNSYWADIDLQDSLAQIQLYQYAGWPLEVIKLHLLINLLCAGLLLSNWHLM